jgi:hypothetical protein
VALFKKPKIVENLYEYLDVQMELLKIDTEEKISRLNVIFLELGLSVIFLGIFLLFFNLALAFYIGSIYKDLYIGFALVAVIHLIVWTLLLIFMRAYPEFLKRILRNFLQGIIKRIIGK